MLCTLAQGLLYRLYQTGAMPLELCMDNYGLTRESRRYGLRQACYVYLQDTLDEQAVKEKKDKLSQQYVYVRCADGKIRQKVLDKHVVIRHYVVDGMVRVSDNVCATVYVHRSLLAQQGRKEAGAREGWQHGVQKDQPEFGKDPVELTPEQAAFIEKMRYQYSCR